jgi:hypothetical protein
MPVTADTSLVTQAFADRLSQANADVFGRMVRVDFEVTIGMHF